jgi:hypothetical protein
MVNHSAGCQTTFDNQEKGGPVDHFTIYHYDRSVEKKKKVHFVLYSDFDDICENGRIKFRFVFGTTGAR